MISPKRSAIAPSSTRRISSRRSPPRSTIFSTTNHRGQAHALLSAIIGNDRTPSFDLIIYQREIGQGGLHKIS